MVEAGRALRCMLDTRMFKVILVRSQLNMRNVSWKRTQLNCSSELNKVELVSNRIGNLAERISKQSIKGVGWFLLTD